MRSQNSTGVLETRLTLTPATPLRFRYIELYILSYDTDDVPREAREQNDDDFCTPCCLLLRRLLSISIIQIRPFPLLNPIRRAIKSGFSPPAPDSCWDARQMTSIPSRISFVLPNNCGERESIISKHELEVHHLFLKVVASRSQYMAVITNWSTQGTGLFRLFMR